PPGAAERGAGRPHAPQGRRAGGAGSVHRLTAAIGSALPRRRPSRRTASAGDGRVLHRASGELLALRGAGHGRRPEPRRFRIPVTRFTLGDRSPGRSPGRAGRAAVDRLAGSSLPTPDPPLRWI